MKCSTSFNCRVCGLRQSVQPWGKDDKIPSYKICSCCGVVFGYEDATKESVINYRKAWLENGARWFVPRDKPIMFDLDVQLKGIPTKYL